MQTTTQSQAVIRNGDELRCVADGGSWLLTVGKEYACKEYANGCVKVRNDDGKELWYIAEYFDVLPDANVVAVDVGDMLAKISIDVEFCKGMHGKYGACGAVESMLRVVAGDVAVLLGSLTLEGRG